jgi:dienelactone hydrolase
MAGTYDPFLRGRFPVGVRTIDAQDDGRGRLFPCEIWYPATARYAGQDLAPETQDAFKFPPLGESRGQAAIRNAEFEPGTFPLILYSHHAGGSRRAATFLCTHLSSHGYIVAALDHSEVIAPELARKKGESAGQTAARTDAVVRSRVPDLHLLLNYMLCESGLHADPAKIGAVGHSLGGWTVLAAPDTEERIRAVVAHAPGGGSNPKPGILRAPLTFAWRRDVPALYLVADQDVPLPLEGMYELFERTPGTKQMLILRRADHQHFVDNVEGMHEAVRAMPFPDEAAWIPKEMRPMAELCSGEQAHSFVRGLTLAHMDARLGRREEAGRFLSGDIAGELAWRGIEAMEHLS